MNADVRRMSKRFYVSALVTHFAMGAALGFFAAAYLAHIWALFGAVVSLVVAIVAKDSAKVDREGSITHE